MTATSTGANSKQIGNATEARAIAMLLDKGHGVSVPFGDNEPYDLIVDADGSLHRVQCKTAWQNKAETIRFNTHSQTTSDGEYRERTYRGDVDAFLVRYPPKEECYWIDIAEAGSQKMELRFDAEIDHPSINWADDYVFDGEIPP